MALSPISYRRNSFRALLHLVGAKRHIPFQVSGLTSLVFRRAETLPMLPLLAVPLRTRVHSRMQHPWFNALCLRLWSSYVAIISWILPSPPRNHTSFLASMFTALRVAIGMLVIVCIVGLPAGERTFDEASKMAAVADHCESCQQRKGASPTESFSVATQAQVTTLQRLVKSFDGPLHDMLISPSSREPRCGSPTVELNSHDTLN